MSTDTVPGKDPKNNDTLHAGCWAEHDKEEPPVDVPMVTPADVPAVALPAAPILITDDGVKVAELVGV